MLTSNPDHVRADQLGPDATDLDVQAYNAALDYLDADSGPAWLWNDGDFMLRLYNTCQLIADAASDSPNASPPMRAVAARFVRTHDTA